MHGVYQMKNRPEGNKTAFGHHAQITMFLAELLTIRPELLTRKTGNFAQMLTRNSSLVVLGVNLNYQWSLNKHKW